MVKTLKTKMSIGSVVFVAISFILILGYVKLFGLPWKKNEAVKEFITQQSKIDVSQKNFLSIDGFYDFKSSSYGVIVVYKDEPGIKYSYEIGSDGLFYQTGATSLGRHLENK